MSKLVRLSDEPEVLLLEDSPAVVEVDEEDQGSRCRCSCGCTEVHWAIASSYCRWCQQGACDCSPSAIAAESLASRCWECDSYGCCQEHGHLPECRCPDEVHHRAKALEEELREAKEYEELREARIEYW